MPELRRAPEKQRRDMHCAPMQIRAATVNEEQRTVEAVISTEQPVIAVDMRNWELIDEVLVARGAQFAPQVVMLNSHHRWDTGDVFGSIRNLRVEGDLVVGRLHFVEGDDEVERAWRKVRQGHITDVSAGYRVEEYVDVPPNDTRTINGKQYKAGERRLRVATRWQLREGSLVPIGADDAAKIRAELGLGPSCGSETMNENLRKYLETLGLREDATEEQAGAFRDLLTDKQRAACEKLAADPKAKPPKVTAVEKRAAPETPEVDGTRDDKGTAPPEPPVDAKRIAAQALAEERDRVRGIKELAGSDVDQKLVARAIDEGWPMERCSGEFLTDIRKRQSPVSGGPGIHSHGIDVDGTRAAIAAGISMRNGINLIDPRADDETKKRQAQLMEMGRRYSGLSMGEICQHALRLTDQPGGGSIREAIELCIRSASSTAEVSNLFTTNINAMIVQSYMESEDSTIGWCREADVADFKSNERVRLSKAGAMTKHKRGGEADHATISDWMEEYKVARYSSQFVIDEMDIIDDRFDKLQQMPQELGAAARRLRPDLVYALILANAALSDGNALYEATYHKNYGTSSTALAAGPLQAGIVAMAKQKEGEAQLNIQAAYLVVPQDLIFTAEILLRSAERIISADSGGTYNPLANRGITSRADNRFGVAGVTDPATGTAYVGTATNWMLLANPMQAPVVEVGYLRGTGRAPVIRQFVLTEGKWGIGWDIKMDIGVKALDYRGIYFATGGS